jgi:hypothetical protein
VKDNHRIGEGMARLINSGRFGKLTEEARTKIDVETKERLLQAANEAGMGESEFLRELILIRIRGFDYVTRIHKERMCLVAGIDPDDGD